jgi:hypothetical protein
MEPTSVELASFSTLVDICRWAELDGTAEEIESDLGSFLALLGMRPGQHWRSVAAIAAHEYQSVLDSWLIDRGSGGGDLGPEAPTPALMAQAGIVGRVARVAGGVEPTLAEKAASAQQQLDHDRALAIATASATAAGTTAAIAAALQTQPRAKASAGAGRSFSMKDIVDVSRNDEPLALTADGEKDFFATYKKFCHREPEWDAEPTADQIAAIQVLISEHVPLYVDLAIFGPHGQRTLRNIKLHGLTLDTEGNLQRIELKGPPTITAWTACMTVFRSCVIGLEALTLPTIDEYIKKIGAYSSRYGQVCWALIYQCDVRFRRELIERIRRECAAEYQVNHDAGMPESLNTCYDPKQPWEGAYKRGMHGVSAMEYWHEYLEETCVAVLSKCKNLDAFIEGDAPISNTGFHLPSVGAFAPSLAAHVASSSSGKREVLAIRDVHPPAAEMANKKQKTQNVHRLSSDGSRLTHTRAGIKLCEAWQSGTCDSTTPDHRCGFNKYLVHACAKCLDQGHGASTCSKPLAADKSKGKGRGKGKGKKGKSF